MPSRKLNPIPDLAANLIELLYLQLADDELIIHAMPPRIVFRT